MKANKQAAGILVLILLVIITFFYYLRGYSYHTIWEILRNADFAYLIAGLCMMFLFICCEAVNIFMVINVLGYKITIGRSFEYAAIGFYFSSITPSASGGQPAQIYFMKKDKIPVTVSSITIFFIIFEYQIAMIFLGCIMFILRSSFSITFMLKLKYLFLFGVIVNTGAVFLLFSLMFSNKLLENLFSCFIKILNKFRLSKKAEVLKTGYERSMISYHEKAEVLRKHPILFLKVFFVTMIQMAAFNMIPSLIYMGMVKKPSCIPDLFTCQTLLTVSVSAIPLPGAEGVYQSGFLQVFDSFFKPDIILSAMLIQRVLSFYLPLVFSFLVYLFTQLRILRQDSRGDSFHEK